MEDLWFFAMVHIAKNQKGINENGLFHMQNVGWFLMHFSDLKVLHVGS